MVYMTSDQVSGVKVGDGPKLTGVLQLRRSRKGARFVWPITITSRQPILGRGGNQWDVSRNCPRCLLHRSHGRKRMSEKICWKMPGSADVPTGYGERRRTHYAITNLSVVKKQLYTPSYDCWVDPEVSPQGRCVIVTDECSHQWSARSWHRDWDSEINTLTDSSL